MTVLWTIVKNISNQTTKFGDVIFFFLDFQIWHPKKLYTIVKVPIFYLILLLHFYSQSNQNIQKVTFHLATRIKSSTLLFHIPFLNHLLWMPSLYVKWVLDWSEFESHCIYQHCTYHKVDIEFDSSIRFIVALKVKKYQIS